MFIPAPAPHPNRGRSMKSYYLNLVTKQWTRGPNLSQWKQNHACSLITKPFPQIVISGGQYWDDREGGWGGDRTNRTDILNLETNEMTRGTKTAIYL